MELSPPCQSPRVQPGSSTPVPAVLRMPHHASSHLPPNLLVHIVVVGQASSLVQCILLHGGISSGLGWEKERRWQGASQTPRLYPEGLGSQSAIPVRTTSSALQDTSPARFLAVQV